VLPINFPSFESYFQQKLNLPFQIYLTNILCPKDLLTEAEKGILESFNSNIRKQNWLLGRQAIKQVIQKLINSNLSDSAYSPDTSKIKFPCSWLSLSHSGNIAVSVALPNTIKLKGLGLDLQLNKFPTTGTEKYFSRPQEKQYFNNLPEKDEAKKRCLLWTIKEACYKANPKNQNTYLAEYEILNFEAGLGLAQREEYQFNFASLALPNGYLSLAICP
jgi:phosphopantetheinyl transferase